MIFAIFLFILGAIVGSFINVVILRLGTGRSIVRGRSECFSCGHALAWYDLVPFFSYLFLGGKCRYCKSKISKRYFAVELVTAALFALNTLTFGAATNASGGVAALSWIYFFLSLVIISFFVAMAFYDFRHKIIPDVLSYGAAAVALVFTLLTLTQSGFSWWRLLAGLLAAAPFAFFWVVSRGSWMGLGDAKLMLSIGWWLGLSSAFGAILIGVFSGAIIGIFILFGEKIRTGRVKWGRHEIPFGPFLVLGALIAHFFAISLWTFLGV